VNPARRTGAAATTARRPERRFSRSTWVFGAFPGSQVATRIAPVSSTLGSITVAYSCATGTTFCTMPVSAARPISRLTRLPPSSSTCTSPVW
jgi:hypothetical protein